MTGYCFRSTQDSGICDPAPPTQQGLVSLCDAHNSLALAITYLTQNNEHQYLDYLSAALHTLKQKMQPPWKTEDREQRERGGVPASMLQQSEILF